MPEYRVCKYDPALRDAAGRYLRPDEWTAFSDVGTSVTLEAYLRVEAAYLDVALAFLDEAGVRSLAIRWSPGEVGAPADLRNGEWLAGEALRSALQRVLREEMWARFEDGAGAFVHFGYDYYMFIGAPAGCPGAMALASARGLFVEPCTSPLDPE